MTLLKTPNKTKNDERPVMVVTRDDDMTADLVVSELNIRGVPVVRLDTAGFPGEIAVSAEVGNGQRISGHLATPTRSADLSRVRSLYFRRPSPYVFPGLDRQDARFAALQARYGLGGILNSLPDCLYVNHPNRIADAEYKPAQLSAAVLIGFKVPATLITNEPARARQFVNSNKQAVFKTLRPTEYDLHGKPATIWTEQITAADLDSTISGTMHLFQEMVLKEWDLRVTVVGNRVFPVRIDSPLTDWRSDYGQAIYSVTEITDGLAGQVRRYVRYFQLSSGCFDFAIEPDGQAVFLECNPNGQWAWLEAETGLPIAGAFADLLERR